MSKLDRQRLKKLGVNDEQIRRLEQLVPTVRAVLTAKPPTRNDVLDKLSKAEKSLSTAHRDVTRLLNAKGGAAEEAWTWLRIVEYQQQLADGEIAALVPKLEQLRDLTRDAHKALRATPQRRQRSASVEPLVEIDKALLAGWGGKPNYPFLSTGEKSRFADVVRIVYEAATGRRDVDPIRALKTLRERKRDAAAHVHRSKR